MGCGVKVTEISDATNATRRVSVDFDDEAPRDANGRRAKGPKCKASVAIKLEDGESTTAEIRNLTAGSGTPEIAASSTSLSCGSCETLVIRRRSGFVNDYRYDPRLRSTNNIDDTSRHTPHEVNINL